jgi:hypothetical protein
MHRKYRPIGYGSVEERRWEMMIGRTLGIFALLVALLPAGCAAIRRSEARNTEQLLAAAGFHAIPANTPERLADLQTMPPLKLVARPKDGHFVYTYADPYNCRCLYVGGPEEYSAYQRLAVQKAIAEEQRQAAMDWELWGPWRWGW